MGTTDSQLATSSKTARAASGSGPRDQPLTPGMFDVAETMLRDCQVRPTRQRLIVMALILANRERGVRAESIFRLALLSNHHVALATCQTIMRTLRRAGLLEPNVGVDRCMRYSLKR
jgi:Fe2+ or Zn2+ uptake regulation protein